MSDQDSGPSDIEPPMIYFCNKCPGLTLTSEEAQEHTHERKRPGPASKKRKPGPASKRGRNERGESPVPAVTRSATAQVEDEDNSAAARNKRAIRSHLQKSKVYNRKNDGG